MHSIKLNLIKIYKYKYSLESVSPTSLFKLSAILDADVSIANEAYLILDAL